MFPRTSIGGLLFDNVEGWTFTVQRGVIAGTFRDDPGMLRITTVAANRLPQPVTHEACLLRAAKLAEVEDPTPSDWKMMQSITGPYGSANFERGSDRVYCWYCCRGPGVIVGTYACPVELSRTFANRGVRMQCNGMITTAVFDRRAWGGTDELTQVLIALLGADEAPDNSVDSSPNSSPDNSPAKG